MTSPPKPATARSLACPLESLEDRVTPATMFAVTGTNTLLTFDSATPGTIFDADAITGLQPGEEIVGVDVRPATGQLYGFGLVDDGATRTGRIYTINPATGAATQVGGAPWTAAYPDTEFGGFNFNPNVDLIRIISRNGPNFRVSPVTGALVGTDTNTTQTGLNGVAYTNNDGFTPTTTLFGLNFDTDKLVTIGGLNGVPSPNTGQVFNVGNTGISASQAYGFEIESSGGVATAFATDNGKLFTANLTTGALTLVGAIGGNPNIRSLTAALPNTITVGGTAGDDTVVVTATGLDSGSYTLNGGTAVAFTGIASFSFLGGGGNDTLTINNPAGGLFAPTKGVIFHGGAGTNSLINTGGLATSGRFSPTSSTDGTLVHIDGPNTQAVSFTSLTTVTDTVTNTSDFEVNGTAAADTVNVVNGPAAGQIQVNSGATPTFATVNVATKPLLRVVTGDGANMVTFNFTNTGVNSVQVNGGNDADTFTVLATAVSTSILGGDGDDGVRFADGATLNGGIVDGETGTDTLDYFNYTTPVAANLGLGVTGLTAALDPDQEVPATSSAARGTATFTNYNPATKTFDMVLTVTDLAPGAVTGLHLHRGAVGVNGPVILDLQPLGPLVPVGTGFTLTLTGVDLSNSLLGGDANEAAFLGGITYLNVHTAANPSGVIRGQVFSTGNVNVTTGTATGTGAVSGIENVIGGTAADGLIGTFGANVLTGNDGNDILLGAPGADTFVGDAGDDIMIWSNGDGSDIMDGGVGSDLVQVNGALSGGALNDTFTVAANGTRIDFDRTSTGPFSLDIGTTEALNINGIAGDDTVTIGNLTGVADLNLVRVNGFAGNDTITAEGGPAGLFTFVANGGEGDDTITGTDGIDQLFGGAGNDFIDGARGNDIGTLGEGNDTFLWNPGDGSDVIEGGAGTDTMLFNGAAGDEVFDVSANGARVRFFRNLGNIVMDLNDVETIDLNTLGGVDTVTVNDTTGTDLVTVNVNLADTIGGSTGDAKIDDVTINGTANADNIQIIELAGLVTVSGLAALVNLRTMEATDTLTINGLAGNDTISAEGVAAGKFTFRVDGGENDDTITGTDGNDQLVGGAGNDFIDGARGNDIGTLGEGNDTFLWNPGDGSDVIEGGDGTDTMLFNGAGAAENILITATGSRVIFFRDVGSITMDTNEVESIIFNALGGIDTVRVGDLSGTAAKDVFVNLGGSLATPGVGDGQPDVVTVFGTPLGDTISAKLVGTEIQVIGLTVVTHITGTDARGDTLLVDGNGGTDAIDLSATVFALPQEGLTSNIAVGADKGGGPVVTTFTPTGQLIATTSVFDASFTGGVRVVQADVNGDGTEDTIVGTGPGVATQVRVLDGKTGAELFSVAPFESAFTGGVFVVAGDINGDGKADLIITPDEGGGPRVRILSGSDGSTLADFFGIEDLEFRGGARAALGDIDNDGILDLLVSAGFGGGPRVAAFKGVSLTSTPVKMFGDFFVFEQTLRNGVFITSGDLDGDGFAEVIVGGGPGGAPRVFAVSGQDLVQNGSGNPKQVANFFAGNPDNRGGVRLAVKNLDGDQRADLMAADGTGAGSRIIAYSGSKILVDGTPPELFANEVFAGFQGGVFIG